MLITHSGLSGDTVWALGALSMVKVPSPVFLLSQRGGYPRQRTPMSLEDLGELLEVLRYLTDGRKIRIGIERGDSPETPDVDFSRFRYHLEDHRHLIRSHLHVLAESGLCDHLFPLSAPLTSVKPWLTSRVPTGGKTVVINLTERYLPPSDWFGWGQLPGVVREFLRHGFDVVFLGLPEEWKIYQSALFPLGVRYEQTSTRLDAVKILCGSSAFIGNPSFLWAVAQGLGLPSFGIQQFSNVYPVSSLSCYPPTNPEGWAADIAQR